MSSSQRKCKGEGKRENIEREGEKSVTISHSKEYTYIYKDEGGRIVVPSGMFEDLDWQSFHETS